MLSTRRCREILGCNKAVTDDDINEIRDLLIALADSVLDLAEARDTVIHTDQFSEILEALPDEHQEALKERVAIREIDGGMNSDEAGRRTLADYLRRGTNRCLPQ